MFKLKPKCPHNEKSQINIDHLLELEDEDGKKIIPTQKDKIISASLFHLKFKSKAAISTIRFKI
jgi:hypothetical protein